MKALWHLRWNFLRLAIACGLVWFLAADTGARLARLKLASAPDFDFAAEVRALADAGRYGEAVMVADAGEQTLGPPAAAGDPRAGERLAALRKERSAAESAQSSWLRRIKDLGMGALSGRGTSIESLVGAVGADFFIVGDVRDLLIQGTRLAVDGEADVVITLLSGFGLAATVAPHVDVGLSLAKIARRTGAMSRRFGDWLAGALRAGKKDEVVKALDDVGTLAAKASPGGALRLMRLADDPADLARMARFAEANKTGAFALHSLGAQAADTLKAAENTADAAAASRAVLAAAERGPAGATWLRSGVWRAAAKPHVLVGLAKGIYKGNVSALIERVLVALGPHAWWLLPLCAAWAFIEGVLLVRKWGGSPSLPGVAPRAAQPA